MLLFLYFLVLWDCSVQLSLLLSNFGCCISKESLFRLFNCIVKWPQMASPAFLVFKIFRGMAPEPHPLQNGLDTLTLHLISYSPLTSHCLVLRGKGKMIQKYLKVILFDLPVIVKFSKTVICDLCFYLFVTCGQNHLLPHHCLLFLKVSFCQKRNI